MSVEAVRAKSPPIAPQDKVPPEMSCPSDGVEPTVNPFPMASCESDPVER